MKISVRALLKNNPDYLALISASFLSGLGSTLSGLAIFHELDRHGADSLLYALAFALTLLPGLVSSYLSDQILRRISPVRLMIGLELLGAAVTGIAMYGAQKGSLPLLLTALPLGSLTYGLLVPFLNTYTKSRFKDDDFLAVAEISNLLLVLDFILGSLIGTLIINAVGASSFFVFDIFSYVIAAGLIRVISRKYPLPFQVARANLEENHLFSWSKLTSKQKSAFMMYPALVAACSPCTAILPGAAKNFPYPVALGGLTFTTSLLLLMAKTKGQFLGPVLVRRLSLDEASSPIRLMLVCLFAFLFCYNLVFRSTILPVSLLLVVVAHLFSNVVFTLSFVEFKQSFSAQEIGPAATRQYQLSLMIMILSSLGVGLLTRNFGNLSAVAFGAVALIGVSALAFTRKKVTL